MKRSIPLLIVGWVWLGLVLLRGAAAQAGDPVYLSPVAVASDGASGAVFVAAHTAHRVIEFNPTTRQVTRSILLSDPPTGLVLAPDGARLYVAAGFNYGTVFTIACASGTVVGAIPVGHSPTAPVLDDTRQRLYLCNRFENRVSVIDLAQARRAGSLPVKREPVAMALTPDGALLVVGHHLPEGAAQTGFIGATVTLLDALALSVLAEVQLPDGSTGVRGVCVSPDGAHAYVTHLVARYQVPTTQLDRGWLMTDAVSIIDLETRQLLNTVLLDEPYKGAANPWGVACSADGAWLCVTHAGSQELSVINRVALHQRLDDLASGQKVSGGFSDTPADVPNDLGFLSGIRTRVPLAGNGPRGLAVAGTNAYLAEYFSDSLGVVSGLGRPKPTVESIPLGPVTAPSLVRQGEMIFNDARVTYQCWLSCASCHPDGRVDGLNWDLANDGLGSPRSAKSMLHAHLTPPAMITGIRSNAQVAVRAGFKFIAFTQQPEEKALAVDAYLQAMQSTPHPSLDRGELGEAAMRGQEVFVRARCADCHNGPHFTSQRKYDVGTGRIAGELLDTPALLEVWRTGPYLQDGRAASLRDVLTVCNPGDQHGVTSGLSAAEIDDLVAYVSSLGNTSDDSSACRAWKLVKLGDAQAPDDADPDADGSSNLQEYYYGTHPLVADNDGRVAWWPVDASTLRWRLPSGADAPDVRATVEESPDFLHWNPLLTVPQLPAGMVELDIPLGDKPQNFYRLGISH
jgi:DNA-binding beta-propeller fold protein YncE